MYLNRLAVTGDTYFSAHEAIARIDLGSSAKEGGCIPWGWYFLSFLPFLPLPFLPPWSTAPHPLAGLYRANLSGEIMNIEFAFLRLLEDPSLRTCFPFGLRRIGGGAGSGLGIVAACDGAYALRSWADR